MKPTNLLIAAFGSAIAVACLTGCNKKTDAISQAEQADKKAGVAAPAIAETRANAEEGFIYGLPIVMNYAVMYEYAVDKGNPEFKAPYNQIKNEPPPDLSGHASLLAEDRSAVHPAAG